CVYVPPTTTYAQSSPSPAKQPRSATTSSNHATTDGSARNQRICAKSLPTPSNLRGTNRERTNHLPFTTHHKERESVDETGYSSSGVPNPPTGCPIRYERGGLRPCRLLFRRWRRFRPGGHSLALQLPTPLRTRADDHPRRGRALDLHRRGVRGVRVHLFGVPERQGRRRVRIRGPRVPVLYLPLARLAARRGARQAGPHRHQGGDRGDQPHPLHRVPPAAARVLRGRVRLRR